MTKIMGLREGGLLVVSCSVDISTSSVVLLVLAEVVVAAAESCSNEGYALMDELAAAGSCSNEGYALVNELAAAEGGIEIPLPTTSVVSAGLSSCGAIAAIVR